MHTALKHQIGYFDAVRALSAQMVVLGHALNIAFAGTLTAMNVEGVYGSRPGVFYVATYGVAIFFVLSGYLISRSVLGKWRTSDYGMADYLVDRATRILLPFLPAVGLVYVADHLVFAQGTSPFTDVDLRPWTLVSNFFMLQDNSAAKAVEVVTGWDVARPPIGTDDPLWTVAVEWWIYVVFGLVIFRVLSRRRLMVFGGLALGFAGFTVLTTLLVSGRGLILAWLVGMFYAWHEKRLHQRPRWQHGTIMVVSAVIVAVGLLVTGYDAYNPVVDVATATMVMSGYYATRRGHAWKAFAGIALASDYSYSLYLVHLPVILYLHQAGIQNRWAAVAAYFVIGNLVGLLFWWAIERHHGVVRRTLRHRFLTTPVPVDVTGGDLR